MKRLHEVAWLTGSLLALSTLLTARPGAACTCAQGPPGFLAGPKVHLPANARGVVFWGSGAPWVIDAAGEKVSWKSPPSADEFSIQQVGDSDAKIPHSLEPIVEVAPWSKKGKAAYGLLVLAKGPLKAGESYLFSGPEGATSTATIAKEPLTLKAGFPIELGAPEQKPVQIGFPVSCRLKAPAAQLSLSSKLPEGVGLYALGLLINTRVDGEVWRPTESFCKATPPGRSWRGPGNDTLFSICAGPAKDDGLAPGKHKVQLEIQIPGGPSVMSEAKEFSLNCKPREAAKAAKPSNETKSAEPSTSSGCGSCGVKSGRAEPFWLAGLVVSVSWARRRKRHRRRELAAA